MNDVLHDRTGRELRIAIAMRGGVSLAVWMGGACCEVARLRASPEGSVYDWVLEKFGYGAVKVDVLAGTSAGGLNGAILASHLVYGMPFDTNIRDIWLQLGHLEKLTRNPNDKQPPSLLRGDEKFFRPLVESLHEEIPTDPSMSDSYVRLILTATRLAPRPDAVRPQRGPLLTVGRSRAHFRFRHRPHLGGDTAPGTALSDFVDYSTAGEKPDATLRALAYAARTTSSFPGAFEPALTQVADETGSREPLPEPFDGDTALTARPVDMRGISSETGAPDRARGWSVELIDGGVLDNIPVSWAVRSIASVPAQRSVDRWLLYLQPVPPLDETNSDVTDDEPGKRRVTRLVRLLRAASKTKSSTESLVDDAEEIRAAISDAQRRNAISAHALLAPDLATLATRAEAATASYRRQVGRGEAARFMHLLEDPIAVLGPDPLPLPPTGAPLAALDAATEDDTSTAARGSQAFLAAFRRNDVADELASGPTPGFRTPFACARAAVLLLDAVRAMEATDPTTDLRAIRSSIYALRFASEVLIAARDRLLLRLVNGSTTGDPLGAVRRASGWLAAIVADHPMPTGPATSATWVGWAEGFAEQAVDALGPGGDPATFVADTGAWPAEPFQPLWDFAATVVVDLARRDDLPEVFGVMQQANTPELARQLLRSCELLLGPLRPDPLSTTSTIDFTAVSAANPSPLEPQIFGARLDPMQRVSRKLSGNQVMNFASFLSARWRAADWTWGRLDAAQSLVESIVWSQAPPADLTVEQVGEFFRTPPANAAAPVSPDGETWEALLDRRWAELQGDRDTEINDANLRRRLIDVVTERLHWEILAEELPVITLLGDRDEPPSRPELDELAVASAQLAPPSREAMQRLDTIGDEKVITLVKRKSLRRSVLRLGLVAWRAIMPSGDGLGAQLARYAAGLTLKPLLWVPLLVALVTPGAALVAGFAAAVGVSVATGRIITFPAQLLALAGILLGTWVLALERRAEHKDDDDPSPAPIWIAALASLALLVAVGVLIGVGADASLDLGNAALQAAVATALLTLSVVVTLFWVVRAGYLVVLCLVSAACTFAVAYLPGQCGLGWDTATNWWAFGLLCVPLAVVTVALTYFYPGIPQDPEASPAAA